MASHKVHTFKTDGGWETIDDYWASPLSYWARKRIRLEPPLPLRVKTSLGRTVQTSEDGTIEYGGVSAMLIHRVQARGRPGQRIRATIEDGN